MVYEYKLTNDYDARGSEMEDVLNTLGAEGWKVIQVWSTGQYHRATRFLLMREVDNGAVS